MDASRPKLTSVLARRLRAQRRVAVGLLTAVALAACLAGRPVAAADGLTIELNRLEDRDGKCHGSFLVRNDLGHTLDRFRVDMVTFDRDGVITDRVLVDMAPLPKDKTKVARFPLVDGACSELGRLLVNAFPACRGEETGTDVDCLAGLSLVSRTGVELFK